MIISIISNKHNFLTVQSNSYTIENNHRHINKNVASRYNRHLDTIEFTKMMMMIN